MTPKRQERVNVVKRSQQQGSHHYEMGHVDMESIVATYLRTLGQPCGHAGKLEQQRE